MPTIAEVWKRTNSYSVLGDNFELVDNGLSESVPTVAEVWNRTNSYSVLGDNFELDSNEYNDLMRL